jgi:hypothetical protein
VADFVWSSPLGVGVALFLAGAAFQLFIGLAAPIAMRMSEPRILVVSERSDTKTYGTSPKDMVAQQPALETYRNVMWTIAAGLLAAASLLQGAIAWFALRPGQTWALPALTLVGLVLVAFWGLALWPYGAARAPLTLADLPPFMWIPAALLVPATVCSWIGLR